MPFKELVFNLDEFPNMFVVAVGWIILQPFVPPFNLTMNGATHISFSVALCCIVAGKGDAPFATIPKNYPKNPPQRTKKWAPLALVIFASREKKKRIIPICGLCGRGDHRVGSAGSTTKRVFLLVQWVLCGTSMPPPPPSRGWAGGRTVSNNLGDCLGHP